MPADEGGAPKSPLGSGIAVFHYSANFFNRGSFRGRNRLFYCCTAARLAVTLIGSILAPLRKNYEDVPEILFTARNRGVACLLFRERRRSWRR